MELNSNITKIYDIFKDFFTEDRVDLQPNYDDSYCYIIVHFPNVTVTNENNKSIEIKNLWARVKIDSNGYLVGGFELIKSEYTKSQLMAGYSHSHLPQRYYHNLFEWANPCLGSGPIRQTIFSLATDNSDILWELFCLELDKYVVTESLAGTPYIKLENVFSATNMFSESATPIHFSTATEINDSASGLITNFLEYVIAKKPFNFNYYNDSYGIAMSDTQIIITLSNLFIEWYNNAEIKPCSVKHLFDRKILKKGKLYCNNIYYIKEDSINGGGDYNRRVGNTMFTFKGDPVQFIVSETDENSDQNLSLFLDINYISYIVFRILTTINNNYGKTTTTPSGKTIRYL